MKRYALFSYFGSFSHINAAVRHQLDKSFPDLEIISVDLAEEFEPSLFRPSVYIGAAQAISMYGRSVLSHQVGFRSSIGRTPAHFRAITRYLQTRIGWRYSELAFTFQTQALHDGSLPAVPHFLYTDHTHLANLAYPAFKKRRLLNAYLPMEQALYRHSDAVFVMSRNIERSLVEQYGIPPTKIHNVLAGPNVKTLDAPTDVSRYARKRILFNGVEWERKGGWELLRAFQTVRSYHPQATLTIIGSSLGTRFEGVTFWGRVPIETIGQHLCEASLFCMPTRIEPFGIAFLEAMHHGLPIVATNVGALPDFVSQGVNGYLVDSGNSQALAARLVELLDDPHIMRQFGMASLKLAQPYDWNRVGQRIEKVVRGVPTD